MKLKVILFVFAGMFILVSCRKEFITTTLISENDSIEADSKGDDPSEVSFSEDESPVDAISGNEVPGDTVVEVPYHEEEPPVNAISGNEVPGDTIVVVPNHEEEPPVDAISGNEVPGDAIVQACIFPDLKTYLAGDRITSIADAGDYLWLTTIKEVYRLEKQTGAVTHFGFDNIEMPANYYLTSISCDENGLPWIGAENIGTLKMSEDGKWDLLPPENTDEFKGGTYQILFSDNGVVWTTTINMLIRYKGDTIETFTTNGSITSMAEDNEGNIWIGTAEYFKGHFEGLVKFDGENWTIYNSSPTGTLPLFFGPIVIDKNGILWMGGYAGIDYPYTYLVEFDGINWHVYSPISSSDRFYITDIAIDETGKMWLATNHGLITFNGSYFNRCEDLNSRLPSSIVFAIAIEDDGKIWVGTDKGLVLLD